jgi:predicted AAA+ superfamily ATPase
MEVSLWLLKEITIWNKLKDILTEFRGRGDEVRVYPLSFVEYITAYDGAEEDAFNDYFSCDMSYYVLSMQIRK